MGRMMSDPEYSLIGYSERTDLSGPCARLVADKIKACGANRSNLRTKLALRKGQQTAAYVTSFNGVLAGLAVSDVLQLILGYAPSLSVRKQYDALSGAVSEVLVDKNPTCHPSGVPDWRFTYSRRATRCGNDRIERMLATASPACLNPSQGLLGQKSSTPQASSSWLGC